MCSLKAPEPFLFIYPFKNLFAIFQVLQNFCESVPEYINNIHNHVAVTIGHEPDLEDVIFKFCIHININVFFLQNNRLNNGLLALYFIEMFHKLLTGARTCTTMQVFYHC